MSSGQMWEMLSHYLISMFQWKGRPASWRSLRFRRKVREKRKPTKANYKVERKEPTVGRDP